MRCNAHLMSVAAGSATVQRSPVDQRVAADRALLTALVKFVWTHSYPCNEKVGIRDYDGPFATPTVANGIVYTVSRKGDVFALDARDGTVIWTRNIVKDDDVRPPRFGGLAGSPLVLGDQLILNASPGGMALDAKTGRTLWKSGEGQAGYASPIPLQIGKKTHLAIQKWTEPKLEFNGLIAVGGKLLVLTETGQLVLVEASPAGYRELGSAQVIDGRAFTAPVFANGRAYVRNVKGDVVCVDLRGK